MTVAPAELRIRVPIHRAGLVRRSVLLARLSGTAQPLVLLVAPPGYGKTTALAQWAAEGARDTAWLTVDESDNDPERMLAHIALALRDLQRPGTGPAPRPSASRRLGVTQLVEQIRRRNAPVLLIMDDVHHLRRAPVPDLLVELATRLPAGSQLAVASRTTPPLKLGRLRADQRCVEFGPEDLAFEEQEARTVLADSGIEITEQDARLLIERTEGWPAGVYLAAMALRDRVDMTAAPGEISGDDAYITDYFRDELLARQTPETAQFLLRTAVLGQFSASLCDAVLRTTGSAVRLAEIERRNLFLVSLDHHREWYRYHRLFAEALVAELRRREPGQEQRVHRRAADWYEQRGMAEQVIMHRIAGADTVGAARAVNLYGQEFVAAGRIATVRGWIDDLGTEAVLAYPPMAVTAAWVSALSGRAERAHRFLLAADRASFAGPLPDGHTSLESAIAVLRGAMGSLGIDRMLLDTRLAYDLEPPGSPWHPLAATMLGVAHLLSGSPEKATKLFERGALLGVEQARPAASLALAQLALLSADDQDWAAAERNAAQAEEVMAAGNLRDDMASVLTHLAAAKVDVRRGRSQQARQRLGTAVRVYLGVPPTAFPWMAAQAAVVLGEVSLELGDTAAARTRVEDARRHLARLLTEGVLRSRLDALSAAVARAGGRSSAPSAMALSAAEERVLRMLPTHLSLGEIGDVLHVSRNTVKSHVGAVYRKLQASTRTEAVTRARELGLLSR